MLIGTDTDRSATYNIMITFHSKRGPISYRFRDKRRFQPKIAKFSQPLYLTTPLRVFTWELGIRAWAQKN